MRLQPGLLPVLILICLGVGAGCMPSSEIDTAANVQLVKQFIAETDAQNFSAYDELLSPDMIQHSPGGLDLDRDQVEHSEREFAEAFPDASRTVDFVLAEGDRVMIRETFRGTHSGAFQGIPATGSSVELTANVVYRIANGKIAESWVEADLGGLVASLSSGPEDLKVVDLGANVTEDLPYRTWGKRQMDELGFEQANSFNDIEGFDPMYFVDSYYTLFNHGGPHVDAPNHMGSKENKSLDEFPLSAFIGKARILDVSHLDQGSEIPIDLVKAAGFQPDEIAIVFTGFEPPRLPDEYPIYSALSPEAAKYLADLPIRAFATDSLGVDRLTEFRRVAQEGATEYQRLLPVHHAFLMEDVLVYEQLQNLSELLAYDELFFVGVPLKIVGGNGMIVRPVVFVE